MKQNPRRYLGRTAQAGDGIMMAWKVCVAASSVAIRVKRIVAFRRCFGAMHTMSAFEGFGNLRTAWFKKSGQDVMPDVINKMRDDLGAVKKFRSGIYLLGLKKKMG